MVRFHCPIPIPIPNPMQMATIVMCRTVSTEPILRPMYVPIPIPMATVPILAPISVLIRWNLISFHARESPLGSVRCSISAYYRNWNRNRSRNRSRAVETHHKSIKYNRYQWNMLHNFSSFKKAMIVQLNERKIRFYCN